jgi:hypothetical protein
MVKATLMHLLAWACISSPVVARPDISLQFGRPLTNRGGISPPISQPPSFPPYTYLGCYVFYSGGILAPVALLDGPSFTSAVLTYQGCANFCTTYTYFSVRYGGTCQCGNSAPMLNRSPPLLPDSDSNCDIVCTGDPNRKCGSLKRANLFRAPPPAVSSSIAPVTNCPAYISSPC